MKRLWGVLAILLFVASACGSDTGSGASSPNTVYAKDFVEVNPRWSCKYQYGYTTIAGKVENSSATYTLVYVKLRGTVLTVGGEVVNTETSFVDSDKIGPGSSSTYDLMISNPNKQGTRCKVEVEEAYFPKDD